MLYDLIVQIPIDAAVQLKSQKTFAARTCSRSLDPRPTEDPTSLNSSIGRAIRKGVLSRDLQQLLLDAPDVLSLQHGLNCRMKHVVLSSSRV